MGIGIPTPSVAGGTGWEPGELVIIRRICMRIRPPPCNCRAPGSVEKRCEHGTWALHLTAAVTTEHSTTIAT